jgi:hypothetical protein
MVFEGLVIYRKQIMGDLAKILGAGADVPPRSVGAAAIAMMLLHSPLDLTPSSRS